METYKMGLQKQYFDFMKDGTKRIELRLYDEKRQKIALGDLVDFVDPDGRKISTRIIGLLKYESFKDLFEDFDIAVLADGSMSKQKLLQDLERFYTPEQQEQYGVLGLRIELLTETSK